MDHRIEPALACSIELGEYGIAVCAYHRGKKIVDAFAGKANKENDSPVTDQTLFPIFSVTKGVTALAWPEFKVNGKENITVEMALSHRSGIPQMPEGVTPARLADWEWMVKGVAQLKPLFAPGTANAYHVLVWGWILGELVRITDPVHRPFDVFVYEEICKPLSVENFRLGVPDNELVRVGKLYGGNSFSLVDEHGISPPSVFPGADVHNTKVIQQAVDPGAGAIADAGSVARIFALIANGGELDGVRLLSPERVAGLTKPRESPHDPDKILPIPVWFGAAGNWLGGEPNASDPLVGDHRDIIYSPGAGGSIAFADIRDNLAVAICHNNMDSVMVLEPERTFAPIMKAIREIVAEQS